MADFKKLDPTGKTTGLSSFEGCLLQMFIVPMNFGLMFLRVFFLRYLWEHFLTNRLGAVPTIWETFALAIVFGVLTDLGASKLFVRESLGIVRGMVAKSTGEDLLQGLYVSLGALFTGYFNTLLWWLVAYLMT